MKRVLIDFMGDICHIVKENGDADPRAIMVSSEFDVPVGPNATSRWVDAPDEVDEFWRLEHGTWVDRTKSWTDPIRARVVAYGTLGDQLDMIYKDMKNGTNLWLEHINKVKAENPLDADLINENQKEPVFHTIAEPSWSYLESEESSNDVGA